MNKYCQSGQRSPLTLVLASTSPYRRELLGRLGLDFEPRNPGIDEAEKPGEPPPARAIRLATEKALACAEPGACVIGSDQVATLEGKILHKPGTGVRAVAQLMACQGRAVEFHTAVTVIAADSHYCHVDLTRVQFRVRPRAEIERYVELENALNCAGGFKVEGLGVTLFERIESQDPTALVGLPLIWLAETLGRVGLDPLAQVSA
jgi:septum formation protein